MKETSLREQLSRYTGVGARQIAETRWEHLPPPRLPIGHPHLGLRNRWYMLCAESDVSDTPQAMRLLGEDLVLWRDGNGRPSLVADYCPHRGAKLSLGDVVDGDLRCWYHGWSFDAGGQCTSIPLQGGECSLQRRTSVEKVYPAEARAGFIWAWIGDVVPAALELPQELEDADYSMFAETVHWDTNWLLALENVVDVLHAPYLHSKSLTLSRGLAEDRVKVIDKPFGFRVERAGQQGVNFDWVEVSTGPLMWMRLDIPYPSRWAAGPGPALRIIGFATPVDEDHSIIHFPRLRKVSGWQKAVWRTLFRLRLQGTHLHVLNQDKRILESIRTLEHGYHNEHLAQSDKSVIHLRKALTPAMEAQLAKLDGTETAVWIGRRGKADEDDGGEKAAARRALRAPQPTEDRAPKPTTSNESGLDVVAGTTTGPMEAPA